MLSGRVVISPQRPETQACSTVPVDVTWQASMVLNRKSRDSGIIPLLKLPTTLYVLLLSLLCIWVLGKVKPFNILGQLRLFQQMQHLLADLRFHIAQKQGTQLNIWSEEVKVPRLTLL